MKKLELKYIAPYLPYGIRYCQKKQSYKDYSISFIEKGVISTRGNIDNINNILETDYYFPILKPISDLSILVKDEFEKYDGIRSGKADEEIINIFCEENGVDEIIENIELKSLPYECVEYMFKNHYDFFGLIDEGLAININEL